MYPGNFSLWKLQIWYSLLPETLECDDWNMEFFGATIYQFWNQNDVTCRLQNALKSLQATLPDIIAVSGSFQTKSFLANLVSQLPGYAVMCFESILQDHLMGRTQSFPSPEILLLSTNTAVIWCMSEQVLFEDLYDQARLGLTDALDGISDRYCFFLLDPKWTLTMDAAATCRNQWAWVSDVKSDFQYSIAKSGSANEDS